MTEAKFTPGPWDYVASTEHHGPYVTSNFGNTICDCYVMSLPAEASTRNGGPSKPIHHLAEMAEPNARLIAAAPEMYTLIEAFRETAAALLEGDTAEAWVSMCDGMLAKARGEI